MSIRRAFQALFGSKPCYRCGTKASYELGGYHYCLICRDVVQAMQGIVGNQQFGFPGGPGHLEFPVRKGESRG